MNNSFQIKKATRQKQKIKILIGGVSGSGKTYSALLLASGMTDWSKICVIDTENESASLYSHLGDFSIIPFSPPYSPERYIEAIQYAENEGFEVIIIDSITQEWDGKGGILEIKDVMKDKNDYAKWSKLTPRHNKFIEKIINTKAHVIATTRVKTDYVLTEKNGKQVPEKVGLKSITRDGVEYEFTLMFDIDLRHLASCSKDRTSLFMDRDNFVISENTGKEIIDWCNEGTDIPKREKPKKQENKAGNNAPPKKSGTKEFNINALKKLANDLKLTKEHKEYLKNSTDDYRLHYKILKSIVDNKVEFNFENLKKYTEKIVKG